MWDGFRPSGDSAPRLVSGGPPRCAGGYSGPATTCIRRCAGWTVPCSRRRLTVVSPDRDDGPQHDGQHRGCSHDRALDPGRRWELGSAPGATPQRHADRRVAGRCRLCQRSAGSQDRRLPLRSRSTLGLQADASSDATWPPAAWTDTRSHGTVSASRVYGTTQGRSDGS